LKKAPRVYATNYFIKDEAGNYLNTKLDKKIWVLWAEGRVNGEYKDAIKTPIGYIPKYEDLKKLFMDIFKKEYTKEEYIAQFSIRISNYLEKYDRMEEQYKAEDQMPKEFWTDLKHIRESLIELKAKHGNKVSPFDL
jgi:phosphoenolpyruvate carboxykinase (GTP)